MSCFLLTFLSKCCWPSKDWPHVPPCSPYGYGTAVPDVISINTYSPYFPTLIDLRASNVVQITVLIGRNPSVFLSKYLITWVKIEFQSFWPFWRCSADHVYNSCWKCGSPLVDTQPVVVSVARAIQSHKKLRSFLGFLFFGFFCFLAFISFKYF